MEIAPLAIFRSEKRVSPLYSGALRGQATDFIRAIAVAASSHVDITTYNSSREVIHIIRVFSSVRYSLLFLHVLCV